MDAMCFFGTGARAVSKDPTGANLPAEFSPWNKFKIISVDDEPEAVKALSERGYFIFKRTEG